MDIRQKYPARKNFFARFDRELSQFLRLRQRSRRRRVLQDFHGKSCIFVFPSPGAFFFVPAKIHRLFTQFLRLGKKGFQNLRTFTRCIGKVFFAGCSQGSLRSHGRNNQIFVLEQDDSHKPSSSVLFLQVPLQILQKYSIFIFFMTDALHFSLTKVLNDYSI